MDTASSFPLIGGSMLKSAPETALAPSDSATSDPSSQQSKDFEATVTSLKVKEDAALKAQAEKPKVNLVTDEPQVDKTTETIAEAGADVSAEISVPTEREILSWDAEKSEEITSLIAALPLNEDEISQAFVDEQRGESVWSTSTFVEAVELVDDNIPPTDQEIVKSSADESASIPVAVEEATVAKDDEALRLPLGTPPEENTQVALATTSQPQAADRLVPSLAASAANSDGKSSHSTAPETALRNVNDAPLQTNSFANSGRESVFQAAASTAQDLKQTTLPSQPQAHVVAAQTEVTPRPTATAQTEVAPRLTAAVATEEATMPAPRVPFTEFDSAFSNATSGKQSEISTSSGKAQSINPQTAIEKSQQLTAAAPSTGSDIEAAVEKPNAPALQTATQTATIAAANPTAGIGVLATQFSERRGENMRVVEAADALMTGQDSAVSETLRQTTQDRVFSSSLNSAPQPVARQIAEALVSLRNGTIDLQLSPEELGRVRLTMSHSETGMLVQVQAERPETLDLLRRNIGLLNDEFSALDLGTATFSFDDSSRQGDGGLSGENFAPIDEGDLRAESIMESETPATIASVVQQAGPSRLDIRL